MGGEIKELNPVTALKKLTVGIYDYRLIIQGEHEDSELSMDVIGFPTTGQYHVRFTNATGMHKNDLSHWLEYESLIFNTDSIEMNMDEGTVTILLSEPDDSNTQYYLEGIRAVIRMEKDSYDITEEDILNNENYKNAMTPKNNPSVFGVFKSLFKK